VVAELEAAAAIARRMLETAEEEFLCNRAESVRVVMSLRTALKGALEEIIRLRRLAQPEVGDVRVDPRDVAELAKLSPAELEVVSRELHRDVLAMATKAARRKT